MPAPQNAITDRPSDNLRSRQNQEQQHQQQPQPALNHSMASNNRHYLVPAKFKGQKSSAVRWIDQFNRYSQNKELEEIPKINDFFSLLEDSAYDYMIALPDERKNRWTDLEAAFKAKYCKRRSQWEAQQQFLNNKQKEGESLEDYIDRVQNEGLKDNLENNLVFSAIMCGMRVGLKPIVAQKNPASLEELENFAEQADSIARMQAKKEEKEEVFDKKFAELVQPFMDKLHVSSLAAQEKLAVSVLEAAQNTHHYRPKSRDRGDRSRTPTPHRRVSFQHNNNQNHHSAYGNRGGQPNEPCQSCGEPHFRSSCPKRNAFCYHCKKQGHLSKVCRSAINSGRRNFPRYK